MNPNEGWHMDNIHLGNISEVRVNNFDYKVFYNDDLFFVKKSKRAITSYGWSGVVLRGNVTMKTADDSTLRTITSGGI
jgi:hypothetical protein